MESKLGEKGNLSKSKALQEKREWERAEGKEEKRHVLKIKEIGKEGSK